MAPATAKPEKLTPSIERRTISYKSEYRDTARDCDVLLWEPSVPRWWKPSSWYGRMIAEATGGGPWCHVTAAALWKTPGMAGSRVMSVGYDEHRGGVAVPLSQEIERFPGTISVLRVKHLNAISRGSILAQLVGHLGGDYEWRNIKLFAIGHFVGLRFLFGSRYRDWVAEASKSTVNGICSQHVARSFFRGANVRFVDKRFNDTSPNDIGLSAIVEYLGTLVP